MLRLSLQPLFIQALAVWQSSSSPPFSLEKPRFHWRFSALAQLAFPSTVTGIGHSALKNKE